MFNKRAKVKSGNTRFSGWILYKKKWKAVGSPKTNWHLHFSNWKSNFRPSGKGKGKKIWETIFPLSLCWVVQANFYVMFIKLNRLSDKLCFQYISTRNSAQREEWLFGEQLSSKMRKAKALKRLRKLNQNHNLYTSLPLILNGSPGPDASTSSGCG